MICSLCSRRSLWSKTLASLTTTVDKPSTPMELLPKSEPCTFSSVSSLRHISVVKSKVLTLYSAVDTIYERKWRVIFYFAYSRITQSTAGDSELFLLKNQESLLNPGSTKFPVTSSPGYDQSSFKTNKAASVLLLGQINEKAAQAT